MARLWVSSVQPARWDDVIAAGGSSQGLTEVLPAVAVQGILSMSDMPEGSEAAAGWNSRLEETAARLTSE
jgi:hypothetical protein